MFLAIYYFICTSCSDCDLPGEPRQFHLWPGIGQGSQSRDHHACAIEAGE